jgi:hypothetical protein
MKRSRDPNIWSGLGASTVAHVLHLSPPVSVGAINCTDTVEDPDPFDHGTKEVETIFKCSYAISYGRFKPSIKGKMGHWALCALKLFSNRPPKHKTDYPSASLRAPNIGLFSTPQIPSPLESPSSAITPMRE